MLSLKQSRGSIIHNPEVDGPEPASAYRDMINKKRLLDVHSTQLRINVSIPEQSSMFDSFIWQICYFGCLKR